MLFALFSSSGLVKTMLSENGDVILNSTRQLDVAKNGGQALKNMKKAHVISKANLGMGSDFVLLETICRMPLRSSFDHAH